MGRRTVRYDDLIAYIAGDLSGEQAERVMAYVASSARARQTASLYHLIRERMTTDDSIAPPLETSRRAGQTFVPHLGATRSWPGRLKGIVADLVYDGRDDANASGSRSARLRFTAEDEDIDVRLERPDGEQRAVIVHVLPSKKTGGCSARALASRTTDLVVETRIDDSGSCTMALRPGQYHLVLDLPRGVVILPRIDVR